MALVLELDIQTVSPDIALVQLAFDWTIRLKRAAAYDGFYLALAENLGCDLWTADKRLHNAVKLPSVREIKDQ